MKLKKLKERFPIGWEGMIQKELETITGINQAAICRIEKMKNIPQLDTLIKLMKPLGLKLTVSKV